MKNIILYALTVLGLMLLPLERADVADLEPIQAVWIQSEENTVTLMTDTEDRGTGATVAEALEDMKKRSLGIVYLDTAQYLLVSDGAQEYLLQIKSILKESVKVCLWDGQGSVSDGAKYMDAHKIGVKLREYTPEINLPRIVIADNEKNVEKRENSS